MKQGKKRPYLWKQSPLLLAFLFLVFVFLNPVIAQTTSKYEAIQLVIDSEKLVDKGDYQTATEKLQKALTLFTSSGDQLNQGMALSNLSLTYQHLGKWQEAQTRINESINILQNLPPSSDQQLILAGSLDILGKLQKEIGKTEEAILSWQQSQKIYQLLGNQEAETQNQINQAQALEDLGFYPRACETLLGVLRINISQLAQSANFEGNNCQALSLLNQEESEELRKTFEQVLENSPKIRDELRIETLSSLGEVLGVMGNVPLARYFLETSEAEAQAFNSPEILAAIKLSLGNNSLLDNNQTEALDYYESASNISQDLSLELKSNLNQLSIFVKQQQWDEVAALMAIIETQIKNSPLKQSKIYSRLQLAKNLMCWQRQKLAKSQNLSVVTQQCSFDKNSNIRQEYLNQAPSWQEISVILQEGLTEAESLNNAKAKAYILGYLGAVGQENNQLSEAKRYTQEALNVVSPVSVPEIRYLLLWQLGRIENLEGNSKEALVNYQAAYDTLQSLRVDLVALNREVQFNFRDSVEPVYREYVSLLLDEQPITQEKLQKSLDAIEALQLAELNNFFRDACVEVRPESLADIVEKTEVGTAIIYAAVLPEKVETILKLPQQELKHYSTAIPQEQVEQHLKNLLNDITDFSKLPEAIKSESQIVYEWLIKPFAEDLEVKKVKNLVFVLDGLLRNIPMAVLYDGQKYLIEKYAVAVTPGLKILTGKPLKEVKTLALTGGISAQNQVGNNLYSELPYVKDELSKIAQKVTTIDELLNQKLLKNNLENKVETDDFNILHLATHGNFSSDPENTYIVVWQNKLKVKEFDKLLRLTNSNKKIPLELLVLSACETAAGDQRATLGLAGISLRAGARSTLASLWIVNDRSTSELMQRFYQELSRVQEGEKISKAEALRRAQLGILRSNQEDWNRPYYWAPFILVGDWR